MMIDARWFCWNRQATPTSHRVMQFSFHRIWLSVTNLNFLERKTFEWRSSPRESVFIEATRTADLNEQCQTYEWKRTNWECLRQEKVSTLEDCKSFKITRDDFPFRTTSFHQNEQEWIHLKLAWHFFVKGNWKEKNHWTFF